jgi:hypothetical protein
MKKAYYLLFYKLYRFFKTISEDGFADWKAGLIIQTLQYFILFIIIGQIELISKNDVIPTGDPTIWAVPLGIALAIFNYYVFLHYKGWKAYENEFKMYSKQKSRVINFFTFFVIFGILSILIFTYYEYSQVDWSKYR